MARPDNIHCDTCESTVAAADARRTETYGGLDPTKWQTLCCPTCGSRLKTVLVGDE
jgi:Zn finger protein HypA/HybF involved in hydrogenase expression